MDPFNYFVPLLYFGGVFDKGQVRGREELGNCRVNGQFSLKIYQSNHLSLAIVFIKWKLTPG